MKNHYSIHTFELRKYCKYKEFNQYLDMFKAEAKGNYKVYMNEKETVICRFEGKGIRMIMKPKKKKPYISFIINPQEVLHNGDLIHLIKHDKLCKALHAVDLMLHDLNKGEFSVNSLDLCRIDISANINVPREDIPHYIALFRKTRAKKGYKIKGQRKSYIARENGFTAENKQAGKAIAIYNKEAQLEQIGKHKQAKRASGIMRVEFQLLKQSTKSVGLQCMILSLATLRSVSEVNLIILDAGGTTLECFEGLPHLSCPVASSVSQCIYALKALVLEMNRRLKLSREELAELPYIVCVFDEFLAALEKDNRDGEKELKDLINDLLRRARKVKIFLILASQSTKQEHLKGIGLTNLTSRVSFRSDSKSNSQSELGCPGAEKLMGKGDMLLKTSVYDAPLRLQGAYISEDEIIEQVKFLAEQPYDDSNKFVIPEFVPGEYAIDQAIDSIPKTSDDSDEKYAQVLIWTLAQTKVSAHALHNALGEKLRLGEKKFAPYMNRMCENGFISEYNDTQPRKVLINSIEDLTEEQMEFLTKCGYTEEQLTKLFENKNKNNA